MLSYKRADRVAELIQQEVSKVVQELKNPEKGFITVTGVKLSPDLQDARIFYSVIGSEDEVKKNGEILKKSTPQIRHQLASRLNLRRMPTIVFEFDEVPTHAARIFEILEDIKKEDLDVKEDNESISEEDE